ncbi:DUF1642 domain-containing protein [Lactococcus lactis]|uniref:DUF1642 domain-containing protein n=1 Tax=Lactococcus lactis TaxID=1358 RepID=UPI0022E97BEC|nr:DUF1642 domain-containing protein [Lactococcus lactis]
MTKFEEEFKALTSWEWVNVDLIQQILTRFGNWHSDEEFQELLDKYSNLNDSYEKEVIKSSKLESQIIGLKSQLQQQALPVVPECVAEFVSGDENELSKVDRIAYLLKSVEGDNYYLEEYLTNAGIISQEQGEHLYAWATNQTHETILKLWNGFTVEKPQLFYLKHIDMSERSRYFDFYLEHDIDGLLEHKRVDKGEKPGTGFNMRYYTYRQSEIDSMQTGSYEQIEVVE